MSKVLIDELRCKGCGLCTIVCSEHLISLSDKINNLGYTPAQFDSSRCKCTGCSLCAQICPDVAITVYKQ